MDVRIFSVISVILVLCLLFSNGDGEEFDSLVTSPYVQNGLTEHPGGIITEGRHVLHKQKSPYWLRSDVIVEKNAEFFIEPGVEVRVEPMVGITVRGVLTAVVSC